MRNRVSVLGGLSVALLLAAGVVHAQAREQARLLYATQVLKEQRSSPDQFVPDRLLERAYGIAIVPDVTKAAFFLGGARGNGVLVIRDKQGRFSNPIFVNFTGGSIGFQWGVQSTDVVLVFTTRRSIDKITSGKLTLGADASVAAGPVGRQASAATDPTISSEVYSYSRSRGLFLGVALDGSALTIDNRANSQFYDRGEVNPSDIVDGRVSTNDEIARRFLAMVNTSTGTVPASASAAPPPVSSEASAAVPASPPTSPAPPTAAKTFPMADPNPGAEPASH
ncbi:MAG TPA: lipid-binding SYLF domain-containing protein [Steroidobacteraceae bacterium]|nr:lipid-binding SYLF domain-containing protein [Steroidobacteraceae bacterium]